jgi:hypothetical protein
MSTRHPAAPHELPPFIAAPDGSDTLMTVMAVFIILSVFGFGILFLWLHTLPERMAHRRHKLQLEIVAVLCLLALFTHIHLFWVAGLLLALIEIPDFGSPLGRMAKALEDIAQRPASQEREAAAETRAVQAADGPSSPAVPSDHGKDGQDRQDPVHA